MKIKKEIICSIILLLVALLAFGGLERLFSNSIFETERRESEEEKTAENKIENENELFSNTGSGGDDILVFTDTQFYPVQYFIVLIILFGVLLFPKFTHKLGFYLLFSCLKIAS